jgi:hypothetical protein
VNPTFGRLRLRLVPALGSLIAATCFAGPLDTVSDCATKASAASSGLKDLSAVCPDLRAALGTLGFDKILYEGWQDKLNVHVLHDLLDLNERYSGPRSPGVPDTSALPEILQKLQAEQAPRPVSWWYSFKNWLKQWLEHSDSSLAKWIRHLFDGFLRGANVSPGFLQAFVYIVTILTAIAAVGIIVHELKAAGIVARLRSRRSAANQAEDSSGHLTDEAFGADENTPAGVLRALVRRLLQTGRLATERSLTHRELIARAAFDSEGQKSVFARIAHAAEIVLYGTEPAAPETLATLTRQGRELLQQLSGSGSAP